MHTPPSEKPEIGEDREVGSTKLTTAEAARYIGVAKSTLAKWRIYGKGPSFLKLGHAVRYLQRDLDAYLASSTQLPTRKL
ncbi:helix-turn-helix transcriptional regulator [Kordiimonas marina]|uniref:helix-turn-helix transcriptional regulator n=1 Tax=Kordiimonas marina TaxID=2872312 RepID=UPI001FF523D5|nr:helix-turn-helix domain-containing protein [Kordiimonas marina]MCJ9430751.1 helix-turn-helix domain-containing protein [Kordiimonas marina]